MEVIALPDDIDVSIFVNCCLNVRINIH